MQKFSEKYGSWALIAGAAEGLGEAFSRALAQQKINLLMVDHQEEKMQELARDLEMEFGISTQCIHLDLSAKDATEIIMDVARRSDCGLLIYNAAFSKVKPFLKNDRDELNSYIDVNCRTQINLVHAFAAHLVGSGKPGGIILMSSLAGLIGMQLVASYAATKAFAWNLAEALHHEFADHNIDIMACLAGATATPAYLATNPEYGWIRPAVLTPQSVAEGALKNLGSKTRYIPGFSNRLNYFILTHILPRRLAAKLANQTMAKMYKKVLPGE